MADRLYENLVGREQTEVARIDEVFGLAAADSCQAQVLSQHFGESIGERCGTCSACLGEGPWSIPEITSRSIGSAAKQLIDELAKKYPDRFTTARQRARFLCGLTSPGLTRARLSRHPGFGVCAMVPFAEVVKQVGGTAD